MEEEPTIDRWSWEESIYWNHFHSIHFYLPLIGDFLHQLALPKKFVENMRGKLGDTVVLKGPGRSAWRVDLAARGDTLLFGDGWSDFVSDHNLGEHDLLFFKFAGESRFEVLMFDARSFCEKEASYFVNRSGVEKEQTSKEAVVVENRAIVANLSPKRTLKKAAAMASDNGAIVIDLSPKKKHRKVAMASKVIDDGDSPKTSRKRKRPLAASPISRVSPKTKSAVKKSDSGGAMSRCNLMSVLNQRTVTTMNEDQKLAVHSAQAAAVDSNSFIIVMRPTHVDKRFYLSIPVDWAKKHLKKCNQDIILRIKEKTWRTKYYISTRNTGGLASGWKKFADDNGLEVPDVCLFKLADNESGGPVCLDVTIFKSAQETTPAVPLDVVDGDV